MVVLAAQENKDMVIHPTHYNQDGRKECWDEMIELFGYEAVVIFDVLSAYKYNYRKGEKDGNSEEQDSAKIDNYMRHAAEMCVVGSGYGVMDDAMETYRIMRNVLIRLGKKESKNV